MSALSDFRADRARYSRGAWLHSRPLYAVAVLRLGQAVLGVHGVLGRLLRLLYRPLHLLAQAFTGIEIYPQTRVGPGLAIYHGSGIVVNPDTVIGTNVTLLHGVTLGNMSPDGGSPTIEDGVTVLVGATVLGPVRVGAGATIGAMSLVLADVPPNTTVVGIPAAARG